MLDDFDQAICGKKHYGIMVSEEDGYCVIRCSFCQKLFKVPRENEYEPKLKSSKSCIQACDWFSEGNSVRCRSCGYVGPLP